MREKPLMIDPRMDLAHYDFALPKEQIAQFPLPNRADCRLMVVDRRAGSIQHEFFRNLTERLGPGDCLVLNDTRVIPAALVGRRATTGGRWRGLFLEQDGRNNWRVLCKSRGRLRPGELVMLEDRNGRPAARLQMGARLPDGSWVVHPQPELDTAELLGLVGRVPLPHYIRGGSMVDSDVQDYQTVYARCDGSVAAPTAGLHFTPRLLEELRAVGVDVFAITLHVGIGTFRPISQVNIDAHQMHAEWGEIGAETAAQINEARRSGKRIIAVGTTAVRLLESASQGGELQPFRGETSLYIRPGFNFQAVDGMLTNFHIPRSTLLVLVRTFGGDNLVRRAYEIALAQDYRFFSYGDSMLIV